MTERTIESLPEIRSILTDPAWRVRPDGQDVPAGLKATVAGSVFQAFARMTDGDEHEARKRLVIHEIDALDLTSIPDVTTSIVRSFDALSPSDLQFIVPGMVIGHLLGVPKASLCPLVEQVRALVVGSRANATGAESAAAIEAMESAVSTISATLDPARKDDLELIAARISMLFQASDAGAALIGNALLALAQTASDTPIDTRTLVMESARARVPVRSTTRYRNDEVAVLNLERAHQQHPQAEWTFGFGPHACPGRALAMSLAVACITTVRELHPFDLTSISHSGWEDLPNVWIPKLNLNEEGAQ